MVSNQLITKRVRCQVGATGARHVPWVPAPGAEDVLVAGSTSAAAAELQQLAPRRAALRGRAAPGATAAEATAEERQWIPVVDFHVDVKV